MSNEMCIHLNCIVNLLLRNNDDLNLDQSVSQMNRTGCDVAVLDSNEFAQSEWAAENINTDYE